MMDDSLRYHERGLLLIASLIVITGIIAVSLATNSLNSRTFALLGCLIACWSMIHLVLCHTRHRNGDPFLLPVAVMLIGIGLTMVLRLKPTLFLYQSIWVIVGLLSFLFSVFFFRRLEEFSQYKYLCGMIGIVLLLIAIVFGVDIGGHRSWVILGPIRFQPSEFAKIFIILFLAAYLTERHELLTLATKHYGPLVLPHPRFIAPLLAIWGLAMVMFVMQRDLGSALLYFGITIIMVYIASGRLTYILLGIILFLIGSFACYKLYSHVQVRVDIWLNPWDDPSGKAYQIVQSLFALGSGGILGSGLTYGFPQMIPEVHTDFIFAAIGEELGFVGASAVLISYIFIIYRAFKIALETTKPFSVLVASGLAVSFALQIFLIIGGVTKFFPLTGITLPFISYGGSSMVANFIVLGMLFAMSEEGPKNAP